MTREEVRQILTLYSDDFADTPEYDEMCEACKVSINSLDAWDKVSKEISFEMKFADGDYYKGLKFANDMLNIIFDKKIKEGSEEYDSN